MPPETRERWWQPPRLGLIRALGACSALVLGASASPYVVGVLGNVPGLVQGSLYDPVSKVLVILGLCALEVLLVVVAFAFARGTDGRPLGAGSIVVGTLSLVIGGARVVQLLDPCPELPPGISAMCIPPPWWAMYVGLGAVLGGGGLAYAGWRTWHRSP